MVSRRDHVEFVNSHGDWERYRTWDDNCFYANHESLNLRAELNHETAPHEATWQIASYASPSAPSPGR
ncbi:hypothetical protein [Streptomyces cinereoruber]|uniref:hypothetical protein n=1 Tax=Streptomyces cinereoruber TaxID=67260 RepID=UPI00363D82AC